MSGYNALRSSLSALVAQERLQRLSSCFIAKYVYTYKDFDLLLLYEPDILESSSSVGWQYPPGNTKNLTNELVFVTLTALVVVDAQQHVGMEFQRDMQVFKNLLGVPFCSKRF